MDDLSLFDFLPSDEAEEYKPKKSTDWKWSMANDYPKEKNGLKVFSCFACGGGSTMGYKLAGCDVIGCCEIDPKMNETYIKNHHPKHNFLMDIRDFNKIPNDELPEELFNLDILDGSPPCTTFSMAGDREDSWGKKKKFREGQAEQTLDDLSFVFIDTVAKLKPYCVIMENVEGLIKGEAWSYVQRIYKQFDDVGYKVKHWLLKGEYMGVPQTRHRVFFIALKKDAPFDLETLDMSFNYVPVTYGEIKEGVGRTLRKSSKYYQLLCVAEPCDKKISDILERLGEKRIGFTDVLARDGEVLPTIKANVSIYVPETRGIISKQDVIHAQTFPKDYDFGTGNIGYICGMSVPPIMIKRIVTRLIESGVFDEKSNNQV